MGSMCLIQLKRLTVKLRNIMQTQSELAAELSALTAQVIAVTAGIRAINTKVAELEAALLEAGNVTPEVTAAVEALWTEVQAAVALLPPVTTTTTTTTPAP
jgi:hypothetical protein